MARNSSGTHSLPAGNPVVGGSTGTSTWANNTLNDLSTEVTDSLSRSGKGGMLAALKAFAGTITAPGIAWSDEVGTGWYRAGAGDSRFALGGADIVKVISTGIYAAVHGAITATSAILRGAVADGASAVGTILDNSVTLANATSKLVSVRNNGTEVAYDDKDGHHYGGGTYGAKAAVGTTVKGNVADGASAVGVIIDNANALANATAKTVSFRHNAVEKSYINKDGKVFGVGLDAGSAVISNVATPSASTDAATKSYVDSNIFNRTITTSATGPSASGTLHSISGSINTTYLIRGAFIGHNAGGSTDIQLQISFAGTGSLKFTVVVGNTYANVQTGNFGTLVTVPTDGSSNILVTYQATVAVTGTGGTISVGFDTSGPGTVLIETGAWMEYTTL